MADTTTTPTNQPAAELPERIWVGSRVGRNVRAILYTASEDETDDNNTEYVRADLARHQPPTVPLDARERALRAAMHTIEGYRHGNESHDLADEVLPLIRAALTTTPATSGSLDVGKLCERIRVAIKEQDVGPTHDALYYAGFDAMKSMAFAAINEVERHANAATSEAQTCVKCGHRKDDVIGCIDDECRCHCVFPDTTPTSGAIEVVDANEKELIRLYRENQCGDLDCEGARFSAAQTVIKGAVKHREVADAVFAYCDNQSLAGVGDERFHAPPEARAVSGDAGELARRIIKEHHDAWGTHPSASDSAWAEWDNELADRIAAAITASQTEPKTQQET